MLAITGITAEQKTGVFTAFKDFGVALGMGDLACATGFTANDANMTCTGATVRLKGTLKSQTKAMNDAMDYAVAAITFCNKITDATKKDTCNLGAMAGLKKWGTAGAAANYYSSLTDAEADTWAGK